ncbi:hypothetical protein C5P26_25965, partial [Escherichia coli]
SALAQGKSGKQGADVEIKKLRYTQKRSTLLNVLNQDEPGDNPGDSAPAIDGVNTALHITSASLPLGYHHWITAPPIPCLGNAPLLACTWNAQVCC